MTNINPIQFGIMGNQILKKEDKKENVKEEKASVQQEAKKSLNSNEVLGFLASQNTDLIPAKVKRTVDVSKYVTPEQEARIAGFVKGFETDYEEISQAALSEFSDLSESAAGAIALSYIDATY